MSTRSQKSRNNQQECTECVSEGLGSPILVENVCHLDQDASIAGPSRPKSPRIENSFLESLRASSKEEITSENKSLLVESQREMLKLLKSKTGENVREKIEEETENETRIPYIPTKSARINSTQSEDTSVSLNSVAGVLNDSTNQPEIPKLRSQSEPASKERPVVARTLFAPDKNDNSTF